MAELFECLAADWWLKGRGFGSYAITASLFTGNFISMTLFLAPIIGAKQQFLSLNM
jgi:hypothetical protein